MISKRNVAAVVAEFLGTAVLAFTFLSVSRSSIGLLYFVSIACGLAIMLMGTALGREVHFNPAYTFAMWTARRIGWMKGLAFILVQILGSYGAYLLFKYLSQGQPVAGVSTAFDAHLLVAEAVGAFVFALVAAGASFQIGRPFVKSAMAGGAYTLGLLVAVAAATAQDPVRFINPAVALASQSWGWTTYVLGPFIGALIGVNLYMYLFSDRTAVKAAKLAAVSTGATTLGETKTTKPVAEELDEDEDENDEDVKVVKTKEDKPAKADTVKEKTTVTKTKTRKSKKK